MSVATEERLQLSSAARMAALWRHQTTRNTSWMLASNGTRFALQSVYFVLVARTLGAAGFGQFAAVAALVGIVLPFATLGSCMLIVRDVARDRSCLAPALGGALGAIIVFGPLLTVMVCAVAALVLPAAVNLGLVVTIALADLVFFNIVSTAQSAYIAVARVDRAAFMPIFLSVARCCAAIAFVYPSSSHTVARWGELYLAATAIAAGFALVAVTRSLGRPQLSVRRPLRNARQGALFSLSLLTATVYGDIDKAMLARLASLDAAGVYTAAYRVVSFAAMPVLALQSATYPEFFVRGQRGLATTLAYSLRLMRFTLAYAVVAVVGLLILAPIATLLLGPGFAMTMPVIRLLAVMLVAQAASLLLANALTGADRQGTRTLIQIIVAIANVGLNLWLIPLYGTEGAIATTVISEFGLLFGLALVIGLLQRDTNIDEATELA